MSAVREYYRQEPVLELTGGSDFDFYLIVTNVTSTTLDGRLGDVIRNGPYDFTGWTLFKGALRTFDGLASEVVSIVLDGLPDEGTLRIRGHRNATWRLQESGYRAGRLTVRGVAPSGQEFTVARCRWNLDVGSTSPTTPSVADWGVLR